MLCGRVLGEDDMTPQEELAALRRLAELEARAGASSPPAQKPLPRSGEFGSPVAENNPLETFRAGMGRAADNALDGITQLYLKARGEESASRGMEENILEKRRLDAPLRNSIPGTLGNIAGDTMMWAVPGAKAQKGAAALTKTAGPLAKTLASLGAAGATGAAAGGLQPTAGDESRTENAAWGAAGGVGGQIAGNVIARAIQGLVPMSRYVMSLPQAIRDRLTLGQAADRATVAGKTAAATEEKLRSIPIAGEVVSKARHDAVNAWRNDLIDDVSPVGFTAAPGASRGRVADIADEFSTRYGNALRGNTINALPAFENRAASVLSDPQRGLVPAQREEAQRLIADYYDSMFPVGPNGVRNASSGEAAKKFEQFLTAKAQQYSKSPTPGHQDMGRLFGDLERAWTVAYRSQLPLATRQALRPLDQQYAKFKTVERASAALQPTDGDFTPHQLLNAVAARTPKARFGQGEGLLQPEANTAKAVFQDMLPNSGTTDRALASAALLGAGAIDPTTTAISLGLALPTMATKTGRNIAMGETEVQHILKRLRLPEFTRATAAPFGAAVADELSDLDQ